MEESLLSFRNMLSLKLNLINVKEGGDSVSFQHKNNLTPLDFYESLWALGTDTTPNLGSPLQVFLDLQPFLCGHFFVANFANPIGVNIHNLTILKSELL